MKIAFFSNQFASTKGHGIARYAKCLYDALLEERGVEVYPVSASANGERKAIEKLKANTGLEVLPWGRRLTPLLWMFFRFPLLENGITHRPEIVHLLSLSYKVRSKSPQVVTIHDIGPLTHPQYFTKKDQWLMRQGLDHAIKQFSTVICVSKATANAVENYAVSNYQLSLKDRLHVIYEGLDPTFFLEPYLGEIDDINLVSSLLEAPFVFSVGKISPRKNLTTVIDAFRSLSLEIPELQLITVGGDGWDCAQIKENINSLGLENRVHILGYVSDSLLRLLYRKALVFVYPSLFEGFGLPILEAMASGCPVITSNTSSLPEVAGDAAILIEPTDVESLKNGILEVYNNSEQRLKMITMGLERARLFCWKKTARETVQVYQIIN